MKEQISDRGYFKIRTSRNRERINIRSHRFVYECIKNVLIDGLEINHIDKNKLNNSIENLEIISRKNNIHHAFFGKKRGFTKNKCNGWDAQININNHIYFIGSYKTKEKAQEKYREIFVEWYGKEPW